MKTLIQLLSLLILCNVHLFAQQSQLGQVPKILIDTAVNQDSYYTTIRDIIPTTDNGFYNINSFSGVRTSSGFAIVNKFGIQKYRWKKSLNS